MCEANLLIDGIICPPKKFPEIPTRIKAVTIPNMGRVIITGKLVTGQQKQPNGIINIFPIFD